MRVLDHTPIPPRTLASTHTLLQRPSALRRAHLAFTAAPSWPLHLSLRLHTNLLPTLVHMLVLPHLRMLAHISHPPARLWTLEIASNCSLALTVHATLPRLALVRVVATSPATFIPRLKSRPLARLAVVQTSHDQAQTR